jgi:hypothetical protein
MCVFMSVCVCACLYIEATCIGTTPSKFAPNTLIHACRTCSHVHKYKQIKSIMHVTHTYIHMFLHTHTLITWIHVSSEPSVFDLLCKYGQIRSATEEAYDALHTYIHTYTHKYVHTYVRTYIHVSSEPSMYDLLCSDGKIRSATEDEYDRILVRFGMIYVTWLESDQCESVCLSVCLSFCLSVFLSVWFPELVNSKVWWCKFAHTHATQAYET